MRPRTISFTIYTSFRTSMTPVEVRSVATSAKRHASSPKWVIVSRVRPGSRAMP
jgi:hypothetical protein